MTFPSTNGSSVQGAPYGGGLAPLGSIFADQFRAAARQIAAEMGVESIREKLSNLPMQIKGHQGAVYAAKAAVADAEQQVLNEKALLQAIIAEEVNPATGKPAFSNAETRAAELVIRQKNSQEYQAAVARLREAQEAYSQAQIALEQLQNEFGAMKAMAHVVAGQLQLLGSH